MQLKSRWMAAVVCSACVHASWPQMAFADDSAQQVEALSKEATKEYRAKNYAKAAELFEKAYAIEAVPNLLFNIAKCYEKLENWPSAIEYYEKFVVQPDIDTNARQSALDRTKALREVIAAEEATKQQAEDAKQADGGQRPRDDKSVPPQTQPADDNTWAFVTLGLGLALVGGGAAFGVMASSEQDRFEQGTTYEERREAKDSGETYALAADGFFITGGILTLVGVLLFVTDGDESEVSAVPYAPRPVGWVGHGGGGLGLNTRF